MIFFCFRAQLRGMHHHWKNTGQCLLIEVLAHQTLQDQQRKPFQRATLNWILKQRLYIHFISLLNLNIHGLIASIISIMSLSYLISSNMH